jgi:amylosucrase
MSRRFTIPADCTWVNYIRSHDDIGWTFADEDAAELGINGYDHRQFLNNFYTGAFDGSFASGLPFNYNPVNQDMRISGTSASLAGLEQALVAGDKAAIDHAIGRILLLHSVLLSAGGIPLIYIGDELGTLNDYRYRDDPAKADDSRWAHRPPFSSERAARRREADTLEARIFRPLQHLIQVRKQTPAFCNGHTLFFDSGNPHVLGYIRHQQVLVLANFSESEQTVSRDWLQALWQIPASLIDLTTGKTQRIDETVSLAPYQFIWLAAE